MINVGADALSGFVDPFDGLLHSFSVIDGDEIHAGYEGSG
jgi:hypothetical protein